MPSRPATIRNLALAFATTLLLSSAACAAEVRVMISGGLTAAYQALVPEFEKATGDKVITAYGPSMGTTVNAIPVRLARGEPADVLILVGYALDDLVKQGKAVADSKVDLVKSPIGIAVKAGAAKPDIGSADAVKRALLEAKSVAYSDSASGVYVSTEMFAKLGITEAMKGKARQIPATPVGETVARGEAEIGLQQIAELKPVAGIDIVGPLPHGFAEDHGVFGRHRQRFERARGRQGIDQIFGLAGGPRRTGQERAGPDRHGRDELGARRVQLCVRDAVQRVTLLRRAGTHPHYGPRISSASRRKRDVLRSVRGT